MASHPPLEASLPHPPRPTGPTDTARWVLPVTLPLLAVVCVWLLREGGPLELARTVPAVAVWAGALALLTVLLCGVAIATSGSRADVARGREAGRAVAVATGLVLLTSVVSRLPTLPPLDELQLHWQGKVLDLLWVGVLLALLPRWARTEARLRLPCTGDAWRLAGLVVGGIFVLFGGLAVVGVLLEPQAWAPISAETFLFDATIPNLTEELIWRGAILAVLDRALPPGRVVLGARLGWGAVITAVVFGVAHAVVLSQGGVWSVSVGAGLFATGAGLVYAWLAVRTGSVWAAVGAHAAIELGADVGVTLAL